MGRSVSWNEKNQISDWLEVGAAEWWKLQHINRSRK